MPPPIEVKEPKPTGPINAVSTDSTPAVSGSSLASITSTSPTPGSATGVIGTSGSGIGVVGTSETNDAINGLSHSPQHAGVSANNDAGGFGLWSQATIAGYFIGDVQVIGDAANDAFNSLSHSPQHAGVSANNDAGGFGLWASGTTAGYFAGNVRVTGDALNDAFNSLSHSAQHAGVSANNDAGGFGLWASGATAGYFAGNVRVAGDALNDAFNSLSHSPQHAGVSANNDAGGFGLWASGATAGYFQGNVQMNGDASVSGTLTVVQDILLEGADCAEEFDLQTALDLDPGTVVVLGHDGALEPGWQSYDRKVAGVISGAGEFRPGMILDRRDTSHNRAAIALMGKVYCKVDAQYGPVEVGDLLTTSPTSGHAMKASDSARAFGAVIGKALRPLSSGQALLPILIALQ